MHLKVTYSGGTRTVEVTALPKDYVAFERQYDQPMSVFSDDEVRTRIEWIYYLAWSPLHRTKQEPRAFDEFLGDVDEIDVLLDEEVVAPFPPAPTAEPSAGSPA